MNKNDRLDLLRKRKCAFVVYWHHLEEHTDPYSQGYIGVAKVTRYANRWNNDFKRNYVGSIVFYLAILKYGDDKIETSVLRDCETIDQANHYELHYRPSPLIGWNIRQGGGNHGAMSDESKRKLSATKKSMPYPYEKIFTSETKEKIRQSKLGNKNMLGKHHSNEVREHMAESARKRGVSQSTRLATFQKVQCIETGQVFESQVAAEKETGILHKLISQSCCNSNRTAGGFHWRNIDY